MLYIIDVLADPLHQFEQVIQVFFADQGLQPEYILLNGFEAELHLQQLEPQPTGVLISGSLHSVYERLPWMLRLEAFIREVHAQQIPLFGICFGHQILASALGGEVANHTTWEFGEQPVYLTAEHPYLAGLPHRLPTLQVHQDHVLKLPEGAQVLAISEKSSAQIFCLGNSFGVQFHPEYTLEMLQRMVAGRSERFLKKGPFLSLEHLQRLSEQWQNAPLARQILSRFIQSLPQVAQALAAPTAGAADHD